jgi:hypothetical protein
VSKYTVQDMMVAYAEDAVGYAQQKFSVTLDYSEKSIEQVELILGTLHDSIPKTFFRKLVRKYPNKQEVDQLCKMLGGYVGEVMRRHWGGEWKMESKAFPGQQVITLHVNDGGDVWPHFKAGKRIINGPEDNVLHYFQILKQEYVRL